MIEAFSTWLAPWNVILGVLVGLFSLAVYLRKLILRVGDNNQAASNTAADRADDAAKSAQASSVASNQAHRSVADLAVELKEAKAARDREAARNDEVWAALLEALVTLREQQKFLHGQELPKRVRLLEQFASDVETNLHLHTEAAEVLTGTIPAVEVETEP